MNSAKSVYPKDLLSHVGNSGFPFQSAVAAAIRAMGTFTVEEEVAWRDTDGSHKFLDMVATGGEVRLCIECKAFRNEKLVFRLPEHATSPGTAEVYGLYLSRVKDSTRRPFVGYGVSQMMPLTAEFLYCVVVGKAAGESRLIEKEAQPLARGTEEYAIDRCREFKPNDNQPQAVICIPILFTTADLFIATYDPAGISLRDGIYLARQEQLDHVRFIRLTKQFTSHGFKRTRLRTVIVAQAQHIQELVQALVSVRIADNPTTTTPIYDSVGGVTGPRR